MAPHAARLFTDHYKAALQCKLFFQFMCMSQCKCVNSLLEGIANCATVDTFKRKSSSVDLCRSVVFIACQHTDVRY